MGHACQPLLRRLHPKRGLERDCHGVLTGQRAASEDVAHRGRDDGHGDKRPAVQVFEPERRHDVQLACEAHPDRHLTDKRVAALADEEEVLLKALQSEEGVVVRVD